jgi:hypothetical protein
MTDFLTEERCRKRKIRCVRPNDVQGACAECMNCQQECRWWSRTSTEPKLAFTPPSAAAWLAMAPMQAVSPPTPFELSDMVWQYSSPILPAMPALSGFGVDIGGLVDYSSNSTEPTPSHVL